MIGLGTIVNVATVLLGGSVGLALGARLPERISDIAMQAVGGVTLLIGIQMAMEAQTGAYVMVVLLSLVLGSIMGEWWDLEGRMNRIGHYLELRLTGKGSGHIHQSDAMVTDQPVDSVFVHGFVTASLLFCVGPMAVLGSLQDGLKGDATILFTKSTLDGIAATALAAAMGPGTLLAALPILLYQGGITLLSGGARAVFTAPVVTAVTACGGIMVIGIGVNMWKIGHIRVGNMLPALVVSGIMAGLAAHWHLL